MSNTPSLVGGLSALVKFLFLAVNQLQLSGLICSPRYLYESSVNMPGDCGYKATAHSENSTQA